MINKPQDFDSAPEAGTYETLPAGAYVCKIGSVEETASKGGAAAVRILLDISEGNYNGFFAKEYRADTRNPKKWGCSVLQLIFNSKGETNPFFKSFCTSVEKSNNFTISWGENFCSCLKGKAVGVLFRREEYAKVTGGTGWVTKPFAFRSVEDARQDKNIPKDKPLDAPADSYTTSAPPSTQYNPYSAPQGASANNMQPLNDDDLPF